ncbi:NTP transferase domain-containing protein [Patescibacteria group bacterium]|nr:NTP transferase domain-containing protein [Patescibacteria group bacterium]
MKGIVMSAGKGTRLLPLTKVVSKEMLPVYDKPMIYYPIETLISGGIKDILLIFSADHVDRYKELLGSGSEFGVNFSYEVQQQRRGTADSLLIGEKFIGDSNVTVIYGDNIFEHDFSQQIKSFERGGVVYAKEVEDPRRFGVVEFDERGNVVSIEEKPENPKSNFVQVGIFTYDSRAVECAKEVKPSSRGELEITDVNNRYLRDGELKTYIVEGLWEDAGTFDSLLRANNFMAQKKSLYNR